ncbi:MAG: PadR family transcriptional regulator [Candidatus Diapherotrites archaeon]|nr:PadR family transcriptional regulator [Candidatus Diapherotrites archaeon]
MKKENGKITKLLFKGHLRYLILKALKRKKLHGYAIAEACYELTNKLWKPSFGSVYPMLKGLEKKGLIKGVKERHAKRTLKVYSLTKKGILELKVLEKRRQLLEKFLEKGERARERIIKALEQAGAAEELNILKEAFLRLAKKIAEGKLNKRERKQIRKLMRGFAREIGKIAR